MVEAKLWRESPVGAGGGGAVAEAELTEAAEAALAAIQRHWRRWSWRDEALARRKPKNAGHSPNSPTGHFGTRFGNTPDSNARRIPPG